MLPTRPTFADDFFVFFAGFAHRCIQEPVRVHLGPQGSYLQAKARSLDPTRKTIVCESVDRDVFEIEYDKLVIAVGMLLLLLVVVVLLCVVTF